MSRVVVSLPAPASSMMYISVSSRVSVRVTPCWSSNSVVISLVMRSSVGCFVRWSTYSLNTSRPSKITPADGTSSPSPSMRRPASMRSRIATWSSSGMPSSMPMVSIGMIAPRSAMKSKRPSSISGSSVRRQNSRTFGSIASIALGVKTRDIRLRCTSCAGGSSMRIDPGGISMPARIISSVEPLPERKLSQSTRPFSTSS